MWCGRGPKTKIQVFFKKKLYTGKQVERKEGPDGNKKKGTLKGASLKSHFMDWWWNLCSQSALRMSRLFVPRRTPFAAPAESPGSPPPFLLSCSLPTCHGDPRSSAAPEGQQGQQGPSRPGRGHGLGLGLGPAAGARERVRASKADPAGAWLAGLGLHPPLGLGSPLPLGPDL